MTAKARQPGDWLGLWHGIAGAIAVGLGFFLGALSVIEKLPPAIVACSVLIGLVAGLWGVNGIQFVYERKRCSQASSGAPNDTLPEHRLATLRGAIVEALVADALILEQADAEVARLADDVRNRRTRLAQLRAALIWYIDGVDHPDAELIAHAPTMRRLRDEGLV